MIEDLRFKIFIVLIGLFIIHQSSIVNPVFAQQTSTPSGSLLEKIDTLKKEIASKAANLKNEVTKKLQNRAYPGFISDITSSEIKLGDGKKVLINEYTQFLNKITNKKRATLDIKDLKVNDYIVALGDVDEKSEMKVKLLIKTQPLASDSSKLVWGMIESVSGGKITVKTREGKDQVVQTLGNTNFLLGSDEASILDARKDKFLVAKGKVDGDILNARFVYYIPAVGFVKPEKKAATSSATPSASPKR